MRTYRQVGPAVATGMNIAVNEILRGGGSTAAQDSIQELLHQMVALMKVNNHYLYELMSSSSCSSRDIVYKYDNVDVIYKHNSSDIITKQQSINIIISE